MMKKAILKAEAGGNASEFPCVTYEQQAFQKDFKPNGGEGLLQSNGNCREMHTDAHAPDCKHGAGTLMHHAAVERL
eukprot:SAG11_NODE_2887_length_2866_cov_17.548247_2_plen_76_part_00